MSSDPQTREHVPTYTVSVFDNDGSVDFMRPMEDPFIHTTIAQKPGLRSRVVTAWRALRGRLEYRIQVSADRETIERVMELNPDYIGPTGSPSRKAWDARLHESLAQIGEPDAALTTDPWTGAWSITEGDDPA